MSIQFGGRTLAHDPSLDSIKTTVTHDGYGLFDAYISMMAFRDKAITLYTRIERIYDKIELNGRLHPGALKAHDRIQQLHTTMLESEALFLRHEWAANTYWQRMSVAQRKEEEADVMLGIDVNQSSILGLWNHPLGESRLPPEGMRVSETVLLFVPPAQAKMYGRNKG